MTTRETLIAARALIDTPEKWCKGSYCDLDGRRCAAGALMAANDYIGGDGYQYLLRATGQPRAFSLTEWNDRPGRTHAEVLAAFDKAIASAA